MLCKAENRDPEHCLKEGRKVTRCAAELCVDLSLWRIRVSELTVQDRQNARVVSAGV